MLQCVAVRCSVLQCIAVCCNVLLPRESVIWQSQLACCSVLQCVAVCCGVLRCVAVCYSVLQYVAVCCSVLQCVAVCSCLMKVSPKSARRHLQKSASCQNTIEKDCNLLYEKTLHITIYLKCKTSKDSADVLYIFLDFNWQGRGMRWLRLVGSTKLQVSFAEYRHFYRALLQTRHPIAFDRGEGAARCCQANIYMYIYTFRLIHLYIYTYM